MTFVDTSFFFAFFCESDRNHGRVVEVFQEFEGRNLPELLLTTDHVIRTSFEEQRAAFEYFKRHADQKYSTIDCLSFVVMESLGIHEAPAVDEDFTHSFVTRPGPLPRRS